MIKPPGQTQKVGVDFSAKATHKRGFGGFPAENPAGASAPRPAATGGLSAAPSEPRGSSPSWAPASSKRSLRGGKSVGGGFPGFGVVLQEFRRGLGTQGGTCEPRADAFGAEGNEGPRKRTTAIAGFRSAIRYQLPPPASRGLLGAR